MLLFFAGRGARFIGNMQGGDSDEVSTVTGLVLLPVSPEWPSMFYLATIWHAVLWELFSVSHCLSLFILCFVVIDLYFKSSL